MKRTIVVIIGIIVLFFGFKSCTKSPEFLDLENVELQSALDSVLVLKMDYKAYNPNKTRVKLSSAEMLVFFKGVQIGKGVSTEEVELLPRDTISIPIECELSLKNTSRYFPQMIHQSAEKFTVVGHGRVQTPIGKINVKMKDSISIDLREMVIKEVHRIFNAYDNFRIQKVELSQISLGQSKVKARVLWKNPMPFDFKILAQDFRVGIGKNNKIGDIKSEEIIEVKSNEENKTFVSSNIDHNLDFFIQSGFSVFFNQKIRVWVAGTVRLEIEGESFDLPVQTFKYMSVKDVFK